MTVAEAAAKVRATLTYWSADPEAHAALDVLAAAAADGDKPNLGLATTGQLLDELRARAEVNGTIGYRTVGRILDPHALADDEGAG
jgi:hypothetical protein